MNDVRVLVVDDHSVFTELLSFALDAQPGIHCIGRAAGVASALELGRHLDFDAAVIDIQLPDGDGLDLAGALAARHPHARIICLTAQITTAVSDRAAERGIPVLAKAGPLADVLEHLTAVEARGRPETPSLTPREHDVAELLREGLDAASIARSLGISVNTAREHIKSILRKTGASSQLAAVAALNRRAALAPVGHG
ncbi:response regulator transcription factor [Agromyces atrinae]|uniref:response regulator transcription factor n=1 Tax=Agromyces atrinae TaxID=592376 RepID=UPI001F598013|nr:response regulator transcription factor [Agromyces atrinae]MCI2957008.1 response regulator transcription factor [Agromyces atrinae]